MSSPQAVPPALPLGGFVPFSTVDWPGKICAVVFTQGCGWRCHYCHNPHLIPLAPATTPHAPVWSEVLSRMARRTGLLDALVFSGGEPILQPALPRAMKDILSLGLQVGLHTGAPNLALFERVLPFVSWVGFDFKAPFPDYPSITGRYSGIASEDSLLTLLHSGIRYEIRTTWHPALLSEKHLHRMAEYLIRKKVHFWTIQRFRPDGCRSQLPPIDQPDPFFPPEILHHLHITIR